jgi:hypothetical protein
MKSHLSITWLFFLFAQYIYGHDVPVHEKISDAAVAGSHGFANYLQDNNIGVSQIIVVTTAPRGKETIYGFRPCCFWKRP